MRGTIESVAADKLVVKDRSGERVTLALPANVTVTEMYPTSRDAVKPGSFVSTCWRFICCPVDGVRYRDT